ncbi:MAG: hypothetical protein H7839_09920 [Magnetococcus sp. YQC-5]
MLIDLMTKEPITKIPRKEKWDLVLKKLTKQELEAIKKELNDMIDGDEIHTAGWMPGSDWTNTPFEAIYVKAASKNQLLAAQLFGLIVWVVFMEREETWTSGRFEKNGEPIGSRTYFIVK